MQNINQEEFVIAFEGETENGSQTKGIKDIFTERHYSCMHGRSVDTGVDGITMDIDLSDYVSVCRFSNLIRQVIEGFGFTESGDYDQKLFRLNDDGKWERAQPVYNDFIEYVGERHSDIEAQNARFDLWVDPTKIIDRNFRMPKGGPLRHLEISVFNEWVEKGMPETLNGEVYDPKRGRIWPARPTSSHKR